MSKQSHPDQPTYHPSRHRMRTFSDNRQAFFEGSDTPTDYLERCLDTIAQREPTIKAWVTLNEDNARQAAEESTKRYRSGKPLSPIDGMPIGIKDVLQTGTCQQNWAAPSSKAARLIWIPHRSSTASGRCTHRGKTVTRNLLSLSRAQPPTLLTQPTPGGSSSGTSAAVGAGMVPGALGNQVVGSIIRPAAFCGNFAIKPTLGALHGGEGLSLSQLHLGVTRRRSKTSGQLHTRSPNGQGLIQVTPGSLGRRT
ncbi:MAG: hypothetical protein CM1200mP41_04380 [Gammaproteobacteria bacterium]|nr:MAG: hypothetical protein CM1200mP41_04380 [Gammaproteobacteria bacterium]